MPPAVVLTLIEARARRWKRATQRSEDAMERWRARCRRLMARLRRFAITSAADPRAAWWSSSKMLRGSRTFWNRLSIPKRLRA